MSVADLTLGCPSEYQVFLVARDLKTYAGELKFSRLSWSRVLDEIAEATIEVPDVFGGLRCDIQFGSAIEPWRFGILIESDGTEQFSGPIVGIERSPGSDSVTVTAHDIMAWTTRRVSPDDMRFEETDAGAIFKDVLEAGMRVDNLPDLQCPQFGTGYTMSREVIARDFEATYDVLQELANSAVDYFTFGSKLVVYDGGYGRKLPGWYVSENGRDRRFAATPDPYGRYIFGLFTEEAWATPPGYSIDGLAQSNDVIVPGADSGEAGFRRFWRSEGGVDLNDGVLTTVEVAPLYRAREGDPITDDDVFQNKANSAWAMRHKAPVVISGGSLSEVAPVTLETLIPGSLWSIDLGISGVRALLDVQRLKRVDVEVSMGSNGITQTVTPTLIPMGSDESVTSR